MKGYKEIALNYFSNLPVIEARGEDIPLLVKNFGDIGKRVLGFTDEDLYQEFCLKEKKSRLKVIKKIKWYDENAIFGKPVLCLIGPENNNLTNLPKFITVYICSKYREIANNYLKILESKGFVIKKFYINGCVEISCSEGIADLIIDIVYTGKSLKKYSLKVYDKIMESDFLIIGNDICQNSFVESYINKLQEVK